MSDDLVKALRAADRIEALESLLAEMDAKALLAKLREQEQADE